MTIKKINLLLDFNLIIRASFNESYKTGLFWTEYNILLELLKNESDKFNFYAFCDCSEKVYLEHVIKTFPEFEKVEYFNIYSPSRYYNKALSFKISILRKSREKIKNIFTKIFTNIKINLLKILRLFTIFLSHKKINLDYIYIYQSFFYPIPKEIIEKNNIKKFVIIHDILPITNPEYFVNSNFEKHKNKYFIKYFSWLNKKINIFTDSSFTMEEFKREFPQFKNNNIIVNLLAADNKKYFQKKLEKKDEEVLKKYNIPTNSKYLLSLCSLNKRKNLAFLVECFVDFLERNPQVQDLNLVLAGPKGWMMDEMLASIKNCEKYKDKIILTGFIDEKDINIIYNGAFAFIFPSLLEGFGLPVLEAMQCGLPVISSNATSLPEVYGNAAIAINPTKKEELIYAISRFYSDENLRKEYIEKGLKQAKKFSWEKTVDNMVNEYLK